MLKLKCKTDTGDPDAHIYYSHEPLMDGPPMGAEANTETPCALLNLVLALPGIAAAEVHRYHIVILKAHAWEWTEVRPGIKRLLWAFNKEMPLLVAPEKETENVETEFGTD